MSRTNDDNRSTAAAADEDGGNWRGDDKRRRRSSSRHEFSDFLAERGVTSALAAVLAELSRIRERPADPLEYVRSRMRPDNEDVREIDAYRRRIDELKAKIEGIVAENEGLVELKRRMLEVYEDQECDWDGDDDGP